MARIFCDSGGDHYVTADLLDKWSGYEGTGGSWAVSATGRTANCLKGTSPGVGGTIKALTRSITTSSASFVLGFAFRLSDLNLLAAGDGSGIFAIGTAGGGQQNIQVRVNSAGTMGFHRGGANYINTVVLGTAASGLTNNTWHYLEFKGTIDNSAGSIECRVNGFVIKTITGVDTQYTSTAAPSTLWLSPPAANLGANCTMEFDDIYLLDGNSPNNDYLGDVTVSYCAASNAGSTTQWDPSAGANYECVNDAEPNDDTDYVSTATVDEIDTYATADAPSGATILATQIVVAAKKGDAGTSTITGVTRHSSTNYAHASPKGIADNTAYRFLTFPQDVNPGTSAAWVEADFNNAEFGIKKTA